MSMISQIWWTLFPKTERRIKEDIERLERRNKELAVKKELLERRMALSNQNEDMNRKIKEMM